MVIDEKQSDNLNEMDDEVAPITNTEVMATDESNTEVPPTTNAEVMATDESNTEVPPTTMV
jgi:hypothetical protein